MVVIAHVPSYCFLVLEFGHMLMDSGCSFFLIGEETLTALTAHIASRSFGVPAVRPWKGCQPSPCEELVEQRLLLVVW